MTTTDASPAPCRFCGQRHGHLCPYVRAIEYYPDGAVRRVEFYEPQSVTVGDVRRVTQEEVADMLRGRGSGVEPA